MAQDKLVVYTDHQNTEVSMNWVHVNLQTDDLTEKIAEVVVGVWKWTEEDLETNGDKVKAFLLDPALWKTIGKIIQWPKVPRVESWAMEQAVNTAITRCKIAVYRSIKMHWTNEGAVTYANRSEAHREEVLTMTGGQT